MASFGGVTRSTALVRVAILFLLTQMTSYLVLQEACSAYALGEVWIHGALGPLAAVKAVPRFKYHTLPGNVAFVGFCLLVLAAPFAYVVRPRLATFVVSAVAVVVWCIFGLGFSIDHM